MSKPIRLNPECIRCLVKGRMDSPPEGVTKEERMMKELKDSEDYLKLAVQFAMMGNYIDFGAFQSIDEDKLEGFLQGAKNIELRQNEYDNLKEDLKKAKRILYLTDNCERTGELRVSSDVGI